MVESETYELVNLGPAATGWRAVMSDGDGGEPAHVPVVNWGLFRWFRHHATGEVEQLGLVMHGLLANAGPGQPINGFVCAAEAKNFEGYLPPA